MDSLSSCQLCHEVILDENTEIDTSSRDSDEDGQINLELELDSVTAIDEIDVISKIQLWLHQNLKSTEISISSCIEIVDVIRTRW